MAGQDTEYETPTEFLDKVAIPLAVDYVNSKTDIIGEGGHDFAWNKTTEEKLEEIIDDNGEIGDKYHQAVDKISEAIEKGEKTQTQIQKDMKKLVRKVKKDVQHNENLNKVVEEGMNLASNVEKEMDNFDYEQFQEDVKELVDNMEEKINEVSEEDRHKIETYVMGANEKFDGLLKKIKDKDVRERVIKRAKTIIEKRLGQDTHDFDTIMDDLNDKVDQIETAQVENVVDFSIKLRNRKPLMPKQSFSYTFEDIMVEDRADMDFFTFDKLTPKFNTDKLGDDYVSTAQYNHIFYNFCLESTLVHKPNLNLLFIGRHSCNLRHDNGSSTQKER
jgi:molybdopterin converting factor small subunit